MHLYQLCHPPLSLLWACGPGKPSGDLARSALEERIDKGVNSRLRVLSFTEADGERAMVNRMHVYRMNYTAEAEFKDAALFSAGNGVTTRALPDAQTFWNEWLGQMVPQETLACMGDRLQLTGTLAFGKRRSRWISYGGQMTWTQDGTHREAPCGPAPAPNP